jgi:LPS sulfotransferase NodH
MALIAYGLRKRGPRPYEAQFSPDMDMPLFRGVPRTYLIATTARCGSHFVGHALWQTGHFGVPLEYLNRGNLPAWHARFRTPTIGGVFRGLARHRTSSSGWFGLKAHWSQNRPYHGHRLFRIIGGIDRALFVLRRDLLA